MLKGFKDFIMRGNVVDLAVAVVMGTAFVGIVTAFSNNIINPIIAAIGGSNEYSWASRSPTARRPSSTSVRWSPRRSTS